MTSRRRVMVDLLYVTGRRGGTETYARELLPRLSARLNDVQLVAVTGSAGSPSVAQWFDGPVQRLRLDTRNRGIWAAAESTVVGRVAARSGAKLLWCPANFGPARGRVPRLVTVHDVIPFEHVPPGLGRAGQRATTWLLRRAARGATRVLAVSEDGARRAARTLDIDPARFEVVPNGGSGIVVPESSWSVLEPLGLEKDRPIVLSVGNRMPHKNFPALLRAVAGIPPDRRPVLVLPGGGVDDPLRPLVAELRLGADVVLPGWVTAEQMGALFSVADLYVCPSLDEGFGLPVVDAMQAGCPVLASDIPVLHEVGGDAVMYTDPRDPRALAAAIERMLGDVPLRRRLRDRGREQARPFTWDRAADKVATVIDRTLSEVTA